MPRILVVDDEPDTREILSRFFARKQYEVVTAESGEAALDVLAGDAPIDAVLLDIHMPGIGGIETLRRIHRDYPSLPVVMITAESDEDVAKKTLREGAFDYVMKPLNFDYLEQSLYLKLAERLL